MHWYQLSSRSKGVESYFFCFCIYWQHLRLKVLSPTARPWYFCSSYSHPLRTRTTSSEVWKLNSLMCVVSRELCRRSWNWLGETFCCHRSFKRHFSSAFLLVCILNFIWHGWEKRLISVENNDYQSWSSRKFTFFSLAFFQAILSASNGE